MELIHVVETITTILTFTLIGTGLPVCFKMYKTGSTRNVPFLFFLMAILVSSLGLFYGRLIQSGTVILINTVAVILWTFYSFVYIMVSKSKSQPLLQLLIIAALVLAHIWYLTNVVGEHKKMINQLGMFLFFWTIIQLLTPVADILDIIKAKSSEGQSMVMLTGGTLCCMSWLIYGWMLKDFFIYGPNVPGLVISGAKFIVISMYKDGGKAKTQ